MVLIREAIKLIKKEAHEQDMLYRKKLVRLIKTLVAQKEGNYEYYAIIYAVDTTLRILTKQGYLARLAPGKYKKVMLKK